MNIERIVSNNDLENWEEVLCAYKSYFPENIAFIRRFEANPSQANTRIAIQTLRNFLVDNAPKLGNSDSDGQAVASQYRETKADLENETYRDLLREMQFLYNKKIKFSNTLIDFAPHQNGERALVVTEILSLKEQYNTLAIRKKHYLQFGEMPTDNTAEQKESRQVELSLAELRLKLKQLHTNKSKAEKSKRQAISNEKKLHYEEKICQLEAEIKNINNQIAKIR